MQLRFTPAAAREVQKILADRGHHLALCIHVRRSGSGQRWEMTLEPATPAAVRIDGVPVLADAQTWRYLEGMVIDWTQTPDGPGFGVYSSSLHPTETHPHGH